LKKTSKHSGHEGHFGGKISDGETRTFYNEGYVVSEERIVDKEKIVVATHSPEVAKELTDFIYPSDFKGNNISQRAVRKLLDSSVPHKALMRRSYK